jgi:hypothetical protein
MIINNNKINQNNNNNDNNNKIWIKYKKKVAINNKNVKNTIKYVTKYA